MKTLLISAPNEVALAGTYASNSSFFGATGRFRVQAVHTRFDAVSFFVFDAEVEDLDGMPTVVGQFADQVEANEYAEKLAAANDPEDFDIDRTYPEVSVKNDGKTLPRFPEACPACGAECHLYCSDVALYACGGTYELKPQIQNHTRVWWGSCKK